MSKGNRQRLLAMGAASALAVSLVACGGGGGGDGGWDGMGIEGGDAEIDPNGVVLVGIAGVTWTATNTTVGDNGGPTTNTTAGITPESGAASVASKATCTTTTDVTTGKNSTTCDYSGYTAPNLSVGGQALPPLPAPNNGYSSVRYALLDFGTAALNVAKFVLMGNSNPGDPLINGIKLSSGFSTTDCAPFDWGTANIEQDAACFLTQADKDGVKHAWASDDTVNQFLNAQWMRINAGTYWGWHANTATSAYPTAGTLRGNSWAVVSPDGTTDGWLDWTNSTPPSTLPAVPWSGTLAPPSAAALDGSLTSTTGAAAPIPNMTVNFNISANGGDVTYQTADGSLAGTTHRYYSDGSDQGPGMFGPNGQPAITFPKYHFQIKNMSYTRPGQSVPGIYVYDLVIGYGSYAEGGLSLSPLLPIGKNPPMFLDMYGQLNKDNTVTLHWFRDTITDNAPTSKAMTLTFDPTTLTLSGTLIGYDGSPWTTITIQGWRT